MSDALKAANQRLLPIQQHQQSPSSTSSPASTAHTSLSSASQQSDNVAHALAGAGGGLLSMALTYPLITLSTRAQVESKKADMSTLEAVKKIVEREGVSGLFAGLDSALLGIGVTNFVYYYWYEWTRSSFESRSLSRGLSSRLTTLESMAAGALAGSATVLCTNPIWVVNTRMTARKAEAHDLESASPSDTPASDKRVAKRPSTLGTLMKMVKEEGPGSLFAGVLPALVLVANPILQYTIFEQLKNFLERRRRVAGKAAKLSPFDSFLLGALGKLAATTITYPYITVKSRAHVRGKAQGPSENMFASFSRILREEGWEGLYGGYSSKIVQSVITTAFLFAFKDVLYETMVRARRAVVKKA